MVRGFTPERKSLQAALDQQSANITASIRAEFNGQFNELRSIFQTYMTMNQNRQPASSTEVLQSVETSTPEPAPQEPQHQHRREPLEHPGVSLLVVSSMSESELKPKEVGFFDDQLSDDHGLGPISTVGSKTVYRDVYTWVERLNDLASIHGDLAVRQII